MQLFLASCALKVAPTGGDKDIKPPEAVKFQPENLSANFAAKEITISFNEFILLKELDKQLIISPIIKPAPEISVKGKNLIVKFEKELLPNTTYTLNFGNAITDLHEGNAMGDFRYVFSTGDFIDTLFINGRVYSANNLKSDKGILVMLYNTNIDSTPYLSAPDFFTRTDTAGNYSLRNINKGPFKVFALKDTDGDYKFNSADEQIGFIHQPVIAGDSLPYNIALFKETPSKTFVKSSYLENKAKAVIVLNKPSDVVVKTLQGNEQWKHQEYNITRDTISFWLNDTLTDSLTVVVSENNLAIDTFRIQQKVVAAKLGRASAFSLTFTNNSGSGLNPNLPLVLMASQPIMSVDTSKIALMQDSTLRMGYKVEFNDSAKRTFTFKSLWKEKKMYNLKMLPGAVTSLYNVTNDTANISFAVNALTDYGSVKVKLSNLDSTTNYLLQLTTDGDVPVYEKLVKSNGEYIFDNCLPFKYKLRIIKDSDNNKTFTTGNYLLNQQPEDVLYYKEAINIRANWDIEIDWPLIK